MSNDYDSSRARKLAKRRKTNLILNSLIGLVLLLIIFVSANIFFGDGQSEANEESAEEVNQNGTKSDSSSGEGNSNEGSDAKDKSNESDENTNDNQESANDESEEQDEESEPIVTEGGSSSDVKQTIVNPTWKPIGTSQTGEHAAVYDDSSVDWQEMLASIAYATGIDVNQMTVWRLANNGGPHQAVGTVSEKGEAAKYRVAIEWVDNEGWKPVKVEELH